MAYIVIFIFTMTVDLTSDFSLMNDNVFSKYNINFISPASFKLPYRCKTTAQTILIKLPQHVQHISHVCKIFQADIISAYTYQNGEKLVIIVIKHTAPGHVMNVRNNNCTKASKAAKLKKS